MSLGGALHLLGELDRSEHCYLRALAIFEQFGDLMNMSIVLVDLGALYRDSGRLDLSEPALRRSARICAEIGFDMGKAFAYCGLGALLAHRGDKAQAEQALLDALAIVREHPDLATEAKIRCTLGELHLYRDPPRAKAHFGESVALAATLGLNGQLARALAGLGDAEQQAGNPAPPQSPPGATLLTCGTRSTRNGPPGYETGWTPDPDRPLSCRLPVLSGSPACLGG